MTDEPHIWIGLSYGRGFLPRRIKVWTRARYWHVKIRVGHGIPTDPVYEARWGKGMVKSLAVDHAPTGQDWFPVIDTTPVQVRQVRAFLESKLGAKYDWWSGLRFVPIVRTFWGDREGKRNRNRFNCSKLAVAALRAGGLEPIPRKLAFRCSPGDFLHSALLADPIVLDFPQLHVA